MNLAIDLFNIPADAPLQTTRGRNGKKSNVSNLVQPVRDIVQTETVVDVPAGTRGSLRPPKGHIYTATFFDGTKREIFVELVEGKEWFLSARYLKEGRKSNLFSEVQSLIIIEAKGKPPRHIIERMERDAIARGGSPASIARIPSIS